MKRLLCFAISALGLFLFGCNRQNPAAEDIQVAKVHSELNHLKSVDSMDASEVKYLQTCEKSSSFRVEARVTPILYEAVDKHILTPEQAITEYQKMIKLHPKDKAYWSACIDHIRRVHE